MNVPISANAAQCEACRSLANEEAQATSAKAALRDRIADENHLVRALEDTQDRIADVVTKFAGSMPFVYFHSAWFAIWMLMNLGALGAGVVFDEFPFGLLTMVVSLEAIFLSTFVMISQNRQADRADLRAQIDFETNVRSEVWAIHIGQKLGIDSRHVDKAIGEAMDAARSAQASNRRDRDAPDGT